MRATVDKLHVENFLSLRELSLELGKLNVLIGPNNSGKSNIIKAIRAIPAVIKRGPQALDEFGLSFRELVFKGEEDRTIVLSLHFRLDDAPSVFEVRVSKSLYEEVLTIEGEALFHSRSSAESTNTQYRRRDGTVGTLPLIHGPTILKEISLPAVAGLHLLPGDADKRLLNAKKALLGISAHSFEPSRLKSVRRITKAEELAYDGHNLAELLFTLYLEDRRRFHEIEDAVRSFVPEVEEILTPLVGEDVICIKVRERGLENPLSPHQVSDGLLRYLAFITAMSFGRTLTAFEEPENCVHPYLLERLVGMMRVSPCQVIISTHSPYLLDHVRPEEVVVVEKHDSETVVRRMRAPEYMKRVKRCLEEGLALGEVWYSGEIGGCPAL